MWRNLRLAWLPFVGVWGLLAGCEHSQASRYPPDPLLVSKRPLESRGESGLGPIVARHEPPAPERLLASVSPPEAGDDTAVPASLRPGKEEDR
jgi:hypothetical protein